MDVPLDDDGRSDMENLRGWAKQIQPDLVLSSDLLRAYESASIIRSALDYPMRCDQRLREEYLGKWQGRTHQQVEAAFPPEYWAWRSGSLLQTANREGATAVAARALASLNDNWRSGADNLLMVTHGNVLHALASVLTGLNPTRVNRIFDINRGSIVGLRYTSRNYWSLI